MSNGEIDVFEELSGVAFEQDVSAGLLGGVGSMFGGPGGLMAGMMGGGSSSAESEAVSGGPLRSGDITFGAKTNTLAIIAAVVLGAYLLFGRKK